MRVLDVQTTVNINMGKKKHKLRKPLKDNVDQSDSSDEARATTANPGKRCTHVTKAINFAAMRKSLGKQKIAECTECAKTSTSKKGDNQNSIFAETSDTPNEEGAGGEYEATVCVCLQCGHQGCDRNSTHSHALKHYTTPHSSSHTIVINLSTWLVWCYSCDEEVIPDKCKRVIECLEYLRRENGDIPHTENQREVASVSSGETNNKTTPQNNKIICTKVKGLNNLGNTCFFNAIMQNLSKTPHLDVLMSERTKKGHALTLPGNVQSPGDDKNISPDLPSVEIILSDAGPLTSSVLTFLRDMNSVTKTSTINPNYLFGQVCKKAPRFKGFQQQDSHELLRYLLDNMKTEEIKRAQTGILKLFKLPPNVHPKKVDSDVKTKIKEYGRQGKHTLIDDLFGGVLLSTIICDDCQQLSTIFEPFLDLSLSITEEKPARPNLISTPKKPEDGMTLPTTDRPNKQQQKKMKKQARREKKLTKSRVTSQDKKGDTDDGKSRSVGHNEAGDSDREETSDADVEDNLESDASRTRQLVQTPDTDITDTISETFSEATINSSNSQRSPESLPSTKKAGFLQKFTEPTPDTSTEKITESAKNPPQNLEKCEQGNDDYQNISKRSFISVSYKSAVSTLTIEGQKQQNETENIQFNNTINTNENYTPNITNENSKNGENCTENPRVENKDTLISANTNCVNGINLQDSLELVNTSSDCSEDMKETNIDLNDDINIQNLESKLKRFSLEEGEHNDMECARNDTKQNDTKLKGKLNDTSDLKDDIMAENIVKNTLVNGDLNLESLDESDISLVQKHNVDKDKSCKSQWKDDENSSVQLKKHDNCVQLQDNENDDSIDRVDGSCISKNHDDIPISNPNKCTNHENLTTNHDNLTTNHDNLTSNHDNLTTNHENLTTNQIDIENPPNHENLTTNHDNITANQTENENPTQNHQTQNHQTQTQNHINNNNTDKTNKNNVNTNSCLAKCCIQNDRSESIKSETRTIFHSSETPSASTRRTRTKSESVQEIKRKAMITLMPRYQPEPRECSVLSCLNQFTSAELLMGNNKFGCDKCARHVKVSEGKQPTVVYANASKHYLIFSPPAVLTLHFKRFEQVGFSSRKVNRHVDFDFILNLSPFCSGLTPVIKNGQKRVIYSLYGVVEHSGRLTGGHYTAYIKVRPHHSPTHFISTHSHLDSFFTRLLDENEQKSHKHNDDSTLSSSSSLFSSETIGSDTTGTSVDPNEASVQKPKSASVNNNNLDVQQKSPKLTLKTQNGNEKSDATNLDDHSYADMSGKVTNRTSDADTKTATKTQNSPTMTKTQNSPTTTTLNTTTYSSDNSTTTDSVATPNGRWYHISDSHVSEVTESMVKRAQAYMLFYERIV